MENNFIPKKNIFLHIGMPKTASTTIQNFLFENRNILKQKGFFFPVIDINEDLYIDRPWVNALYLYNALLRSKSSATSSWEKYYLSPFYQSGANNMILSNELFSFHHASFLDNIDLSNFNVKIVIYIRPSIEYLCSSWTQACMSPFYKNFNGSIDLDTFLRQQYNVPEIIETYAKKFGVENIILRTLEKEQFKNGSLYDDILDCFGLSYDHSFKPSEDQNPSANRNLAELLRLINKMDLPLKEHTKIKEKMLHEFSTDPKVIETISDDTIKEITDKNRGKEDNLARLILKRENLFISEYSKTYKKERPEYTHVTWSLKELELLNECIDKKSPLRRQKDNLKKKIKELLNKNIYLKSLFLKVYRRF